MERLSKDSLYYIFLEILRLHYYRTHVLLDEIGVYPGQPPLLFILNKEDGLSQKEIAAKLDIKPSTITVMLRRMEKTNLVERRQDAEDQRVSRVYLTEAGRDICDKSMEVMKKIEEECFGNFIVEEKVVFRRLLMQMRDNLLMVNDKESGSIKCE
ncbi:MarR family transcriptional regulator [Proteiniborus sp. MB09-C3]|uniref:MarR family winged helix-turn-helix transcriptional regulator n=1 Tax=Proteiniborus sp. MB09-C3 TaxID=3050072 RepID=UPI0025525B95|nr:MarR family transcriptional regulator [Proteiniborus sp. MB09-C3]WIV12967.1 MarR family transcriptional regulator [Proteiniborus sp. MB09-C3]